MNMNIHSLTKQVKQSYRDNIDTILSYRAHSGKYRLNPAKVEEWIRAQYTPRRQEVARLLIDKVHYFTYSETFDLFFNVVSKMVNLRGKPIYILIQPVGGNVGQSTFMFALLGYHALINILDIPMRDIYFTYAPVVEGENVIFDDFSYSGSQISQIINNFYEFNKHMSIHICLLGASKRAHDFIQIQPKKSYGGRYMRLAHYGKLPSNYHFYVGKIINDYDVDMNEKDKNDVTYFFNPFNKLGKTLVYFDHKIADERSTIMFVLKHGLVIPQNYFINVEFLKSFNRYEIKKMVLPEMEPAGSRNELRAVHLIDMCHEDLTPIKHYVSYLYPINQFPEVDFSEDSIEQFNQLEKYVEEEFDFDDQEFSIYFIEDIQFNITKGDATATIDDYILGFNLKQFFQDRDYIRKMPKCPVSFYKQKGIFKRERLRSANSFGSSAAAANLARRSPNSSTPRSLRSATRQGTRKSPAKSIGSHSTRRRRRRRRSRKQKSLRTATRRGTRKSPVKSRSYRSTRRKSL
jgi:hypothetical protein